MYVCVCAWYYRYKILFICPWYYFLRAPNENLPTFVFSAMSSVLGACKGLIVFIFRKMNTYYDTANSHTLVHQNVEGCVKIICVSGLFLLLLFTHVDKIGTSHIPDIMFQIIDTDNDGVISAEEYTVFFQIVGFNTKLVPEAFQAIDVDKDGVISHQEFIDAYVEYCKGTDESHPSRHMFGHMGM